MKSWPTISIISRSSAWPIRGAGFESLILANQPEHIAAIRPEGRVDFDGTLIRLHIGLENVDDLIGDLVAGFQRIV
ncbi:cystathionine beta-lyase [Kosakonia cowanii]